MSVKQATEFDSTGCNSSPKTVMCTSRSVTWAMLPMVAALTMLRVDASRSCPGQFTLIVPTYGRRSAFGSCPPTRVTR